jgi:hypothetical protein
MAGFVLFLDVSHRGDTFDCVAADKIIEYVPQ